MTDWAAEKISAYNDFKTDGFEITVRIPGSEGGWNAETMSVDPSEDDTDFITYAIRANYSIREIDGTVVQLSDSKLLLSPYGSNADGAMVDIPELSINDEILIDSVVQNVVGLNHLSPGNVVIMYILQVRK